MSEKEVYIPKDLDEAINCLLSTCSDEDIQIIKSHEPCEFHFSMGMSLRNSWGLWSGGPLYDWFRSVGLYHADDMSAVILDALKCRVENTSFDLYGRVKYYQDYWRKNYNLDKNGNEIT